MSSGNPTDRKKSYRPATQLVHGGTERTQWGETSEALILTSGYMYDSAEQAQDILREAPGIMLVDKREDEGYITPVESVGDGATYISRVREDPTVEHGLNLWCVSDNLRKGAALNAVQIAELLGRRHLKKG